MLEKHAIRLYKVAFRLEEVIFYNKTIDFDLMMNKSVPHKPMTIFITGVAGFLGSHLASHFLKQNNRVIGCDNLSGGSQENVPDGTEFFLDDCLDFSAMDQRLEGVDLVYHCAASPHEGLSVFSPYYISQNTFGATISIVSAAVKNKVKRFIFCSSMARYGALPVPFTEDLIPHPQDPYGIAKYAAELCIKNLADTHGMEYSIAVPHNIIGTRQKYDDPYRNVVSIMINLMLQGKQPIIYGDGEQKRCFSSVEDIIVALDRMGTYPDANGQIINVGPDDEFISINDLAKLIAELLNFELKPIYVASRPQEVLLATCHSGKARSLLGFKSTISLKETVRIMIEDIRRKGTKPFKYHIKLEIINDLTPKTWVERRM